MVAQSYVPRCTACARAPGGIVGAVMRERYKLREIDCIGLDMVINNSWDDKTSRAIISGISQLFSILPTEMSKTVSFFGVNAHKGKQIHGGDYPFCGMKPISS